MKKLFLLILTLGSILKAQYYHDIELTKYPTENGIKSVFVIEISDTSGYPDTTYRYILKDTSGRSNLEYSLNTKGDTLSIYQVTSKDENNYETFYTYNSTVTYKKQRYNKDNFLIETVYDRDGTHLDDTTVYIYNKKNQLIKCICYRSYGVFMDTLIYKQDILDHVLHYDKYTIIPDTTKYLYDVQSNLIKYYKTEYLKHKEVTILTYNSDKLCTSITEYRDLRKQKFENIITTTYTYNAEGKTKTTQIDCYENDEHLWQYKSQSNEKGYTVESNMRFYKSKGGIRKKIVLSFY